MSNEALKSKLEEIKRDATRVEELDETWQERRCIVRLLAVISKLIEQRDFYMHFANMRSEDNLNKSNAELLKILEGAK